jgi:hypothetical protein
MLVSEGMSAKYFSGEIMAEKSGVSGRYFVLLVSLLFWVSSCGGSAPPSESTIATIASPVAPTTFEPIIEDIPIPKPTEVTPARTVVGEAETEHVITPKPTANPILKPTATSTPKPTATSTPKPTATPTPQPTPTPTVQVQPTVYDDMGFSIKLDDKVDITTTGWSETNATEVQGALHFPYKGVNALLIWMPAGSDDANAVLTNHYNLLTNSQPDSAFTIISDGEITVDGKKGAYGTFVAADKTGTTTGGGIIGGWICSQSDTSFGLTVTTDLDSTTLQIRFSRLINSFGCSV